MNNRKQIISINIYMILFSVIVGSLIVLLEPSRLIVLLCLIVLMGTSCFHTWREMDGKEWRWFLWSRKLVNYEKEKLGSEWFKSKRSELTLKILVILMFAFQLFLGNIREPFSPIEIGVQYWLFLLLGILILTNINLFFRNRKIDQLTTEELQGFTKKEMNLRVLVEEKTV